VITQQIHDISQEGYEVRFNSDFEGMLTITYQEEYGDYIRHEHLGCPGFPMERLEKDLQASLKRFLEEVKSGNVKKDGLAKK
jgi:hypothetical protein